MNQLQIYTYEKASHSGGAVIRNLHHHGVVVVQVRHSTCCPGTVKRRLSGAYARENE